MSVTYKDIDELSQKSSVAGTEKLPVSDTQYLTPAQIATCKQVHLQYESEMPGSPDADTMYLIDEDGTIPAASNSTIGGIKTGFVQSGKSYPVQLDGASRAYITMPFAIVYLTDESQMPVSPDSQTLYLILES